MSDKTLEQLDEHVESIKSKLQLHISELVDIITGDLPNYTLKQIRRAFIEDVDFAETQSDKQLLEFKNRVHAFGDKLAADVRSSLLENMEDWWGSDISLDAAGKTLDGNTKINQKLSVVSKRICEFIEAEHLAPIEIVYKTPAYFINGKYAPGIIEKYWSQLSNLRAAEEERAVVDREARKARIAERWDSI